MESKRVFFCESGCWRTRKKKTVIDVWILHSPLSYPNLPRVVWDNNEASEAPPPPHSTNTLVCEGAVYSSSFRQSLLKTFFFSAVTTPPSSEAIACTRRSSSRSRSSVDTTSFPTHVHKKAPSNCWLGASGLRRRGRCCRCGQTAQPSTTDIVSRTQVFQFCIAWV